MLSTFSSITFGELELSNITVISLCLLSLLTFLSVIISSIKLISSSISTNDK